MPKLMYIYTKIKDEKHTLLQTNFSLSIQETIKRKSLNYIGHASERNISRAASNIRLVDEAQISHYMRTWP